LDFAAQSILVVLYDTFCSGSCAYVHCVKTKSSLDIPQQMGTIMGCRTTMGDQNWRFSVLWVAVTRTFSDKDSLALVFALACLAPVSLEERQTHTISVTLDSGNTPV